MMAASEGSLRRRSSSGGSSQPTSFLVAWPTPDAHPGYRGSPAVDRRESSGAGARAPLTDGLLPWRHALTMFARCVVWHSSQSGPRWWRAWWP